MVSTFTYKVGLCFDPSGTLTLLEGGLYLLVERPLDKYAVKEFKLLLRMPVMSSGVGNNF